MAVAEWIVALDKGVHTSVATPYYATHNNLKTSSAIRLDDSHFAQPTPTNQLRYHLSQNEE